jgi:membrane protease YdiL (CAAX protease family)
MSLAFGLSIVASVAQALSYSGQPIEFGDSELVSILGYQVVIGAIVGLILRRRGWKWSDFAVHYSRGATILGMLLAAAVLGIWKVFELLFGVVPVDISASLPWIVVVSVVNPWFEELLVLAYVVQAMRGRFGLMTAMNVSLGIRISYHLYQGPLAVIPIAIFALVATVVYVRLGRLWPVVVMHAIVDFVGFISS